MCAHYTKRRVPLCRHASSGSIGSIVLSPPNLSHAMLWRESCSVNSRFSPPSMYLCFLKEIGIDNISIVIFIAKDLTYVLANLFT